MSKLSVLVLFGGMSPEHDVSCSSAASVLKNIDKSLFEVSAAGITKEGHWYLTDASPDQIKNGDWANLPNNNLMLWSPSRDSFKRPDCVFPLLHGENGEDGALQGFLTLAGIPFVGCKMTASAICMDKIFTKLICAHEGIQQARFIALKKEQIEQYSDDFANNIFFTLGCPVFVKPANTGSSVGVSKAKDKNSLHTALKLAAIYDQRVLVEEFIDGYELEIAILGNKNPIPSCIGQIIPSREFYTYESKYIDGTSGLIIDPDIPLEAKERLTNTALQIYELLDCSGLSRVDFFMRRSDNAIVFNEINTIPGFTDISMYPKLFEHSGLPYKDLITKLIYFAIEG